MNVIVPPLAAGEDYDPTPQTVLFGQQDLTVCADFGIFADDVDEGPEIFSISLQLPSIPGLTLGPVASTTVTIIEGDLHKWRSSSIDYATLLKWVVTIAHTTMCHYWDMSVK